MFFFFFFSGQEGRKGWWASYTCLGRGVGGEVVCVLNKYYDLPFLGLPLKQSQCNLMY